MMMMVMIIMIIIIDDDDKIIRLYKTRDAQFNCSPPTDCCPASS